MKSNRHVRSLSPQPTSEQAEKLRLAQQAIKKRNSKGNYLVTYQKHIIASIVIAMLIIVGLSFKRSKEHLVIDEQEISTHNSLDYPFRMGSNEFFANYTIPMAKPLFNNQFTLLVSLDKCPSVDMQLLSGYNFREQFPECRHEVYDQGNCSSSYAIAAASAFSDRLCKKSQTQQLSAQSPLSCEGKNNLGCKGGHLTKAIDYIINHGLTTKDCHPFTGSDEFEECSKTLIECPKHKANQYCQLQSKDEIKKDIFLNGPVVALITVYKDFLGYRDGVYQVLEGTARYPGAHAVKIIGWGEQNGYQYWIIENSWGVTWGENGYGKVAMDGFLDISEKAVSIR